MSAETVKFLTSLYYREFSSPAWLPLYLSLRGEGDSHREAVESVTGEILMTRLCR